MGAKMQLRSRSVDDEAFFKRTMRAFYQKIGARRMHELGHGTKEQFASAQAKLVYATWRGRIHPLHYPRYLPCKVFSFSPLTQYILVPADSKV